MMTRLIFPMLLCALVACSNNQDSPSGSSQVNPRDSLATVQLDENAYNVALLVMDGTFNTELTAPMDIFQHTKYRENIKPMNVFTIANTLDPIKTFEGLTILPDFDYTADYPEIDILVIPAAEHNLDSDLHDEALLTFIKSVNENALYVTSHCDDRVSTTFPGDVDAYKVMYPTLDVREDVVFVHDGKYITSAGGAKSFEASLYLCELLYGKKVADELAEGMVIDWNLARLKYIVIL
jgi:transcriptional regulator GlxA family with amidase domain